MVKIVLLQAHCKRCGKLVTTTSHSLLGLDALKAKFGILCEDCVTPEERHTLLMEQGQALAEGRKESDGND